MKRMIEIFKKVQAAIAAIAVLFAAFMLPVQDAQAQSAACRQIRAQIASLPKLTRASNSGKARRLSRAISRQKTYISRASKDLRRNRCLTSSGRVSNKASSRCRRIASKYREMRGNLSVLQKQLARASGGGNSSSVKKKRNQLNRKYSRLGCSQITAKQQKKAGFLERIFGRRKNKGTSGFDGLREETNNVDRSGGVYRTLCVRMCDGYYFPINFATYRSQFDSDERLCRLLSGHEDSRIFAYRNPGGTPEEMTDINGQPYTSLTNAFKYRTSFDASCQRPNRPNNLTTIAGANGTIENGELKIDVNKALDELEGPLADTARAKPIPRPNLHHDPETQLMIDGEYSLRPVLKADPSAQKLAEFDPQTLKDGTIRLVGPELLDGQGSVKLLQVPGREAVPSTPGEGA